jgi:molybdopterin molybdotransferase
VLAGAFAKSGGQRRFVRARLAECAAGRRLPLVTLPDAQASGQLFSALDCNCLVDIPAGSEVEAVLL